MPVEGRGSTKVLLCLIGTHVELPAVTPLISCEEHDRLRQEAVTAILEARNIRWNRDLSFYQDSELSRAEYQKIDALLKHLLVGHDGQPCPSGDRPIIQPAVDTAKFGRGSHRRDATSLASARS
jgi:hypothetical protein